MIAFIRFFAGLFLGCIFVAGSGAIGYIVYEEFGLLQQLIIAAIIILLVLNITAITSFPRSITTGLVTPQIALMMGLAFFYSREELAIYFTDDIAYRSCVGNLDNKVGALDCTKLLKKLETKGHIVLKEIEDTKGEYWIAEVLSYRGRHYLRDGQTQLGKADFARALSLPQGVAVTVNNLAEAGYTRSDLFKPDYEAMLAGMAKDARCLSVASKLDKKTEAEKFSSSVSSNTLEAIKLCKLSTGRDEETCDSLVNERIRSVISLSNRFFVNASKEELQSDYQQCSLPN